MNRSSIIGKKIKGYTEIIGQEQSLVCVLYSKLHSVVYLPVPVRDLETCSVRIK